MSNKSIIKETKALYKYVKINKTLGLNKASHAKYGIPNMAKVITLESPPMSSAH
ncbi:hypothetical protein QJS10_CPB12g00952 [Acorus calamus]|uniref:Uncharacterized protein n=1 Tax=Acorus calamus TaxID=4465 RepID=A0AAV9DNF5_ACOCL|nr:hypothetical protein QJS10_CPB12g00952 [Acorus calamus]